MVGIIEREGKEISVAVQVLSRVPTLRQVIRTMDSHWPWSNIIFAGLESRQGSGWLPLAPLASLQERMPTNGICRSEEGTSVILLGCAETDSTYTSRMGPRVALPRV